jgi:hypothetical protein
MNEQAAKTRKGRHINRSITQKTNPSLRRRHIQSMQPGKRKKNLQCKKKGGDELE